MLVTNKYEQQKRAKEAKAKQTKITLKEVRVSPTIGSGDYETKLKQARKFLSKGDKVQFSLRFKGRMITHKEIGRQVLERILEDLKDEVRSTNTITKKDTKSLNLGLAYDKNYLAYGKNTQSQINLNLTYGRKHAAGLLKFVEQVQKDYSSRV